MSFQIIPAILFVPQGGYEHPVPHTIRFSADGDGISIVTLKNMTAQSQAVLNGTEPAMEGMFNRTKITFRVVWPGYHHDAHGPKTINVDGLTRSGLASEAAKHVVNFIAYIKQQRIPCAISDSPFAIMERNIKMVDIRLVGIMNTGDNCWQPVLCMAVAPESG